MDAADWLTAVVIVVAAAAVIWLAILAATRATRLNRLNIRVDLARASVFAALDRRAVVARAIAASTADPAVAAVLAGAADAAEHAEPADREAAENHRATVLAQTDPVDRPAALTSELADAQARVSIARRFYNDSVRDARTLGSRRMVRILHLGGHATLPEFLEISERVAPD
ncbi:NUDIX hydrolase [Gordonia sp. (in: high G+C Gram-positive bacteria)]|uniref:NUDIX hydrolase n=1 Tax=Gordonia sp. (in: high G+C Gram-positive bacteria) TaxID=84139 RepID=UPI00261182F9|nr:NUDIX hydrolase [Gordonia sp. (in: high G+C Gram-positive bacteria)]